MTEKCSTDSCSIVRTLQLVGNKWVILIMSILWEETKRFGELQREIDGISTKVLTGQLRKMERDGLISRKVYPEVPPKVEYSLTEKARSLEPIMCSIVEWGKKYPD